MCYGGMLMCWLEGEAIASCRENPSVADPSLCSGTNSTSIYLIYLHSTTRSQVEVRRFRCRLSPKSEVVQELRSTIKPRNGELIENYARWTRAQQLTLV